MAQHDFVAVGQLADIPDGTMKSVDAGGKKITLIHIGDSIFAIDDTCSHAQCSFAAEGFLDGSSVICGCHGSQFDISTGRVLSLPAITDIGTYGVKITDGKILVSV